MEGLSRPAAAPCQASFVSPSTKSRIALHICRASADMPYLCKGISMHIQDATLGLPRRHGKCACPKVNQLKVTALAVMPFQSSPHGL